MATQNQAPEVESHFYDSSGPLFSMYLERAEEEDQKMAESWMGDAEGMLVFVSAHLLFCVSLVDLRAADWSVLRHGCDAALNLHPVPPTKLSRYFSVLPRENLSATLQ
jgi:hypothetical protein